MEQLKTYAEILIPVTVVYTPAEMKEAVGLHSDKDLILIDTSAGAIRTKPSLKNSRR